MNKTIAIIAFAAAVTSTAIPANASTFTVTGSGSTFTISRSGDTSAAETVRYRTVPLSAFPGQHYTATNGVIAFAAGQTSANIVVSERSPSADAYKYQTGSSRSYRFEVLDNLGVSLAGAEKAIDCGSDYAVPASGAFGEKSLTVLSGETTVTDGGFGQGYHEAPVGDFFASAGPKGYFLFVGAQLRMLLDFRAKEVDDGHQFVQILANRTTGEFDVIADDKTSSVIPSLSRYMAGFSHYEPNGDGGYANYTFPVTSVGDGGSATTPWTGIGNMIGDLRIQRFVNSGCRASDGRLVIPTDLESLTVRFDASGDGLDAWTVGSVVARVQAVDGTAPTILSSDIAVSPGPYYPGNTFRVSMPFSEIVTVSDTATLTTTWGTLNYEAGSGGNVLTFVGAIAPSNYGFPLGISGLSGTVQDLAGNAFAGSIGFVLNGTVIEDPRVYRIYYHTDGGTLPPDAPQSYAYGTVVLIPAPTRPGYVFVGWTGFNGDVPQTSTSIPKGSHGEAHFTAHWIKAPWPALQERLWSGGAVSLTNDYVAAEGDSTLTITNAVTLDLAGHSIDASNRFCVVEIRSGGNLVLTNSVEGSGAITGGGDHGVFVGDGGVFRLRGGAIAGNASSYAGGGLFVDAGGCAWMSGGAITNNACTGYVKGGGGVFVAHDGEFNLSGGVIGGNTADEGGGVYVENSYGGTRGGYFEMTGGEISGNVAQIGGGVFLKRGGEEDVWDEDTGECYQESFDPSVLRMGGGVISGNSAIGSADGYGYAAGIYVEYDDSLFVYGSPVVSGNTNELDVADNVHLASGALDARIGIQGALSAGALIGVTAELDPTLGYPTTVTTGAASGDRQYFFSDNPNYSVGTNADGQVCLAVPVVVSYAEWSAANGVEGAWDATDALGIHNVFRYVFDNLSGAFTNPPLISISFNTEGKTVIHTPPLDPTATGFDISIRATDTMGGQNAATYPIDASGETVIPEVGKPARFFRLKATEE